ncbi:MAG: M81 family metallopeptidase [archaeon]
MRFVIGMASHETNVFAPVKTDIEHFRERELHYGEELLGVFRGTKTSIGGFVDAAEQHGIQLIPTIAASAMPSGLVTKRAYDHIRDRILDGVRGSGEVDAVVLALHGSMAVEELGSAEGDLLSAVRAIVGAQVPVVCTLDLHATVTRSMMSSCDLMFGFDTNPHVDSYERAKEAIEATVDMVKGRTKPVKAIRKPAMMPPTINMRTTEGPMTKIMKRAFEMEKTPKVININVAGGFPYMDTSEAGFSVVVMTNDDMDLAEKYAEELANLAWNLRKEFLKPLTPVRDAIRQALDAKVGPVVLADVADNPGGGGSGDGTTVLQALIEMKAQNVGFAVIKDLEAVQRAIEIGVGGTLSMAVGGKTDSFHGHPVQIEGVVKTISDGAFVNKGPMETGITSNLGKTAVVQVDGIELLLSERKMAPNDPEIFRRHGIEPTEKKILVLKSRGHFRAAYEVFAKQIIEVDAPGLTSPNLKQFPYRNVRRPIFPLDDI